MPPGLLSIDTMKTSAFSVSVSDHLGRVFYDAPQMEDYYGCVDALRRAEWTSMVTGFYLFRYRWFPRPASLRLSYFVPSDNDGRAELTLARIRTLTVIETRPPQAVSLSGSINNEVELRFRRFLCIGTQVALELMGNNLENAKRIFHLICLTSSWQIVKDQFMNALVAGSAYFNLLPVELKEEFVKGAGIGEWRHNLAGTVIDDHPGYC